MSQLDREKMRDIYDALGADEWDRFDKDIPSKVNLEIHQRFLAQFVKAGDRVLEIGAGPGRFTKQLIELDTKVIVTDISPVQIELNKENFANSKNVESLEFRDICNTSKFSDGEFELVLAYGGPLSYAFDEAEIVLNNLFLILKPQGMIAGSVISTLGAWRSIEADHICQMYKSSDLETLVNTRDRRFFVRGAYQRELVFPSAQIQPTRCTFSARILEYL